MPPNASRVSADHPREVCLRRHVRGHPERRRADRARRFRRAPEIRYRDLRALLHEAFGERAADALRAAGDDGDLPRELHSSTSLLTARRRAG